MGNLYIVATPIGNMQDITFRAILTLNEVGAVLCEDTRQTKKLFERYEIKTTQLIPLNEFNEENVLHEVLELLKTVDVALVSDAGTPLISDPGYRLVVEARKRNIRVIPIPGASAIITALSASGLPTDKFVFLGFLPKKNGKAVKKLESVKGLDTTVVLYESPHRVAQTLKLIMEILGDIRVTVARELTKIHEEIYSDTVSALLLMYEKKQPKGEFVILFSTRLL
jgi:16S rRNA (cytidine1402-2'-O)-methyltransferase